MQKYRRFTDEKTGVNPFIKSSKWSTNFIVRVLLLVHLNVTQCIKTVVFLVKFPICLGLLSVKALTFLPEAVLPGVLGASLTKIVNKILLSVFLFVANVYEKEDKQIDNVISKRPDIKLFLSNHCNILDTFFYILKLSPLEVVVQIQGQHQELTYTSVRGMGLLFAIFSRTGFYRKSAQAGRTLNQVYADSKKAGRNLLLYYEGVKTNGGGVLSIRQQLADNILELQTSVAISSLKYICANDEISAVTVAPLKNFYHILTVTSIKLKSKAKVLQKQQSMHSRSELIENLYDFYDLSGMKQLDLVTADYFDFIDFYNKTQSSNYTKTKGESES